MGVALTWHSRHGGPKTTRSSGKNILRMKLKKNNEIKIEMEGKKKWGAELRRGGGLF